MNIVKIASCIVIAVGMIHPAFGQEEPPDGCFCLAEAGEALPQVQKACSRQKFPNNYYWKAICRYRDSTGEEVVAPDVLITEKWTVLAKDHHDCRPCELTTSDKPTVPRGESTAEDVE
jgi:hypothetical protein